VGPDRYVFLYGAAGLSSRLHLKANLCRLLVALTQDAVHIITADADRQISEPGLIVSGRNRSYLKAKLIRRSAVGANQVRCQSLQIMQKDRALLVPVSVQLDPALLHQYAAEMLGRIKSVARVIAFHIRSFSWQE